MRPSLLPLALAVILGAAACASSTPEPARTAAAAAAAPEPTTDPSALGASRDALAAARPDVPVANPTEPTPGELDPRRAAAEATSEARAKTATKLSDAEILGVLIAANDGEVKMADIALRRASADSVKAFATMMKQHHGEGLQKTRSLAAKVKITPAESDVSTQLESQVADIVKELKSASGSELDAGYMDAQVKAHKDVLRAIEDRLQPSVDNGQVSALLHDTKRIVEGHLHRAIELDKKVGSGIAARDRGTLPDARLQARR